MDPVARARFIDVVLEMLQGLSCTVVLSTHLLEDVEKVADRVIFMDGGRVKSDQSLDVLRERYLRVYIAPAEGSLPEILPFASPVEVKRDARGALVTLRGVSEREVLELARAYRWRAECCHVRLEEIYRFEVGAGVL